MTPWTRVPAGVVAALLTLLLASVLCWPHVGVRAGPAAPARSGNAGILVLSQLSAAQNQALMMALAAEVRSLPNPVDITRVDVPPDRSDVEQEAAVRQALAARPWQLVISTTSDTTVLVMELAPRQPLLFQMADDPVANCWVAGWRQPGGHATGSSSHLPAQRKQIDLLIQAYPQVKHAVVLVADHDDGDLSCDSTPSTTPTSACRANWLSPEQEAHRRTLLHLTHLSTTNGAEPQIHFLTLCTPADVAQLPQWLARYPSAGLVVPYLDLFYETLPTVIHAAHQLRLPAVYQDPRTIALGGLLQVSKRKGSALTQVRRILGGVPPGQIPVQRPDGFEVSLNLTAARQLGRPPSLSVLRSADHLVR